MRITKSTPSYDPKFVHWDRMIDYPDGRFYVYGTRRIGGSKRHLTHVILSHMPRKLVTIAERALEPNRANADFLSIRVGTAPSRVVPLSLIDTAYITIQLSGKILIERKQTSLDEFKATLPDHTPLLKEGQPVTFVTGAIDIPASHSHSSEGVAGSETY